MADEKKVPTLLNREIVDQCPCGEKVQSYQRQRLTINPNDDKWYRVCGSCITANRSFAEKDGQFR